MPGFLFVSCIPSLCVILVIRLACAAIILPKPSQNRIVKAWPPQRPHCGKAGERFFGSLLISQQGKQLLDVAILPQSSYDVLRMQRTCESMAAGAHTCLGLYVIARSGRSRVEIMAAEPSRGWICHPKNNFASLSLAKRCFFPISYFLLSTLFHPSSFILQHFPCASTPAGGNIVL